MTAQNVAARRKVLEHDIGRLEPLRLRLTFQRRRKYVPAHE